MIRRSWSGAKFRLSLLSLCLLSLVWLVSGRRGKGSQFGSDFDKLELWSSVLDLWLFTLRVKFSSDDWCCLLLWAELPFLRCDATWVQSVERR
jgi:hypothetical protein